MGGGRRWILQDLKRGSVIFRTHGGGGGVININKNG